MDSIRQISGLEFGHQRLSIFLFTAIVIVLYLGYLKEGDGYAPACAYAIIGRSSEFYRMLSTTQLRVLLIAKMRTIAGGRCLGLFQRVFLKLCAIGLN